MTVGMAENPSNPHAVVNQLVLQYLSKSVAGASDVTLTDDEANYAQHDFNGVLTGNINVIVPDDAKLYHVTNSTTGAFTLTIKTSGGTGIAVGQGKAAIVGSDGTNVIRYGADV